MYFKPIQSKDIIDEKTIEYEWDTIAEYREHIISEGKDISLLDVTEPFILKNLSDYQSQSILDCGCGTGHLSALIARKFEKNLDAIDISGKSINIAKRNFGEIKGLNFYKRSIIEHINSQKIYDCCIANMVLMDTIDLKDNLKAIYNMTRNTGAFIFTITHPCFWPIYWNYFNESWFDYNKEIYIKAPFKISGKIMTESTHIHRPLNMYLSYIQDAGFDIIKIEELFPTSSHLDIDYFYDYPRFLGVVCKKTN